jgi:hypothetical protein
MDYELDENQVDFSGPSYSSAEGCEIDWHEGKNVTVRIEKKKQKKKGVPLRWFCLPSSFSFIVAAAAVAVVVSPLGL